MKRQKPHAMKNINSRTKGNLDESWLLMKSRVGHNVNTSDMQNKVTSTAMSNYVTILTRAAG